MNRRDALKSLFVAPVAAAVPMAVEPESFGIVNLNGFTAAPMPDSFLETIPGLIEQGPVTFNMKWTPEPEPETIRLKGVPTVDTNGSPICVDADFEMPYAGFELFWLPIEGESRLFTDTGERDAKGRRIFA
jgi:hypothetical protein